MKALKCLDGTPISKIDRLAAEAFIAKGREAERSQERAFRSRAREV